MKQVTLLSFVSIAFDATKMRRLKRALLRIIQRRADFINLSNMLSKVFEVFFRLSEQEFEDPRDADDAVYECNGKEMMGERWLAHSDFTKH